MKSRIAVAWLVAGTGVGGLALSLPSCSQKPGWRIEVWEAGLSSGPAPKVTHLAATEWGGKLNGQQITLERQEIAGVPIEHSFVKTVSRDGRTLWVKARNLSDAELPNANQIAIELKRRPLVKSQSENKNLRLGCRWRNQPKPFLRYQNTWKLLYVRECEEKSGRIWNLTLTSDGDLLYKEAAGASFESQQLAVYLFPRGPRSSPLQRLQLTISSQPSFLFTPNLEVTSDEGLRFSDSHQIENSTPDQDSFDMLQAYYYATEALKWVQIHLQFQLANLKIRTQVGFPEKSNVAFYYSGEIRLGSGDGQIFWHIPWDPSIVIHETMHPVIESLTGLPFQGEGGSLQEGLADFLTALQLNNPYMGETSYKKGNGYQRTLDNSLSMAEKNGGLYHDSLILSGTLWQIRQAAGPEVAENLVRFLLTHLTPDSKLLDAGRLLRKWLLICPSSPIAENCESIRTIVDQRGWP